MGEEIEQAEETQPCPDCNGTGVCTDCDGEGADCPTCGGDGECVYCTGADIAEHRVPVERMSLGDWRRLMESTPGRLPTCGEMGRASEQCSSEWGWRR